MKKESISKKVIAGFTLASIGLAGLTGLAVHNYSPYSLDDLNHAKNQSFEAGKDSVEPVLVPVKGDTEYIYENVTVEKEVEVDNGDMDWAFQRLEDKDILDDAEEVLEELKAEDAALELALKEFDDRSDLFDLLEDEGLISDEDEASVIKIYSDFEDVEVVESDFDDEEYEFQIRMKIEDEDEDEKKYLLFNISVEDGESEILSVVEE